MDMKEETLSSKLIYDGKILHVYRDEVKLPNGEISAREHIKHNGAVGIIPITHEGDVLLERQFRYPFGDILIEIPAGKLDSPDEDPRAAALRELREETGAHADTLIPMGEFYGSPGILGERLTLFLATDLTFGERELDEDEFLEVFRMPLDKLVDEILKGHIPDGKTQAAALRAAEMLRRKGNN